MRYEPYVTVAFLSFFVLMNGYLVAQRMGGKRAMLAALAGVCWMLIITTAYRWLGAIYYPAHEQLFVEMDRTIFGVMFAFFFSWMAGISLWNWVVALPPNPVRAFMHKCHCILKCLFPQRNAAG